MMVFEHSRRAANLPVCALPLAASLIALPHFAFDAPRNRSAFGLPIGTRAYGDASPFLGVFHDPAQAFLENVQLRCARSLVRNRISGCAKQVLILLVDSHVLAKKGLGKHLRTSNLRR